MDRYHILSSWIFFILFLLSSGMIIIKKSHHVQKESQKSGKKPHRQNTKPKFCSKTKLQQNVHKSKTFHKKQLSVSSRCLEFCSCHNNHHKQYHIEHVSSLKHAPSPTNPSPSPKNTNSPLI